MFYFISVLYKTCNHFNHPTLALTQQTQPKHYLTLYCLHYFLVLAEKMLNATIRAYLMRPERTSNYYKRGTPQQKISITTISNSVETENPLSSLPP